MSQDYDFSKNRAEEFGEDLWNYFIIPPFYKDLGLFRSNKPLIVEGGRGSGKTMLLRYLCHKTQFSQNRNDFPGEAINRIGVYWKIDTQFTAMMSKRKKEEEEWNPIFINWGVLEISEGILSSIASIASSKYNNIDVETLKRIDFSPLKDYYEDIPSDFVGAYSYIKSKNRKFQLYISNLKGDFLNLPFRFIKDMIFCIKDAVKEIRDTVFDIYIDEYENLQDSQCKIINTWIKHSEIPLIFNVAMKKNAMRLTETMGNERIVAVNDYRKVELDSLVENYFETFATEMFLLKLYRRGLQEMPIEESRLFSFRDEDLAYRTSEAYVKEVKAIIKRIFPSVTVKDVAASMLGQSAFVNRIKKELNVFCDNDMIERILSKSQSIPEAIIVLPSIMNRKSVENLKILEYFFNYSEGENNQFKNWIDNNLFGCILFYYGALNKICPLYSGFDAFITMSKDNLRHFLELCLQSITLKDNKIEVVPPQEQALAVRSVSENMFGEIKSLGNRGNELSTFAMRLGTFFEEARKRIQQSEPEQNHFNIADNLSDRTRDLIDELVKWSVLYEYKLTKQKNLESGMEYMLNPIYSSYFTISYRKKRRIDMSNADFETIAFGEVEDYKRLLRTKFPEKKNEPGLFKD